MDLIYMSDVMAYQSIRSPIYDRYEQRWDQPNSKERATVQQQNRKRGEKEPCKICQEKQRRSLMTYIRSKSHEHTDESCISEQIEEEEEEEQAESGQQQQQPAAFQSTNSTNQGQDGVNMNSQTVESKERSY